MFLALLGLGVSFSILMGYATVKQHVQPAKGVRGHGKETPLGPKTWEP